jgi:hypothetical protein
VFLHTRRAPHRCIGAILSSSHRQLNHERESHFLLRKRLHSLSRSNQFMRTQTPKFFLFVSTRQFASLSMFTNNVINTVGKHKTCLCEEHVTVTYGTRSFRLSFDRKRRSSRPQAARHCPGVATPDSFQSPCDLRPGQDAGGARPATA